MFSIHGGSSPHIPSSQQDISSEIKQLDQKVESLDYKLSKVIISVKNIEDLLANAIVSVSESYFQDRCHSSNVMSYSTPLTKREGLSSSPPLTAKRKKPDSTNESPPSPGLPSDLSKPPFDEKTSMEKQQKTCGTFNQPIVLDDSLPVASIPSDITNESSLSNAPPSEGIPPFTNQEAFDKAMKTFYTHLMQNANPDWAGDQLELIRERTKNPTSAQKEAIETAQLALDQAPAEWY